MIQPHVSDLAKEVERIVATAEQYGDNTIYSLSDIKTLLLQIASQSRELEELRRPVVRSDAAEAVFKLMRPYDTFFLWNDSRLRELIQKWCEPLLSALDQAQREIARLSSPPEERREIAERRKLGYSSASVHLLEMYNLALADIDTLIQDLRRYSNAHAILLAERDEARQSLKQESELHQARKDLVVQLTSERDEARGKCETLQHMNEHLNHVRDDLLRAMEDRQKDADQYQAWASPQIQRLGREMVRIERLEAALQTVVDQRHYLLKDQTEKTAQISKFTSLLTEVLADYQSYIPGSEPTPGIDCIQRIELELAAADGQQEGAPSNG